MNHLHQVKIILKAAHQRDLNKKPILNYIPQPSYSKKKHASSFKLHC